MLRFGGDDGKDEALPIDLGGAEATKPSTGAGVSTTILRTAASGSAMTKLSRTVPRPCRRSRPLRASTAIGNVPGQGRGDHV